MCGNRLNAWNTIPIRRRMESTFTPRAVISSPSMRIRPASIGSMRLMQRRSVDLPLPDAPISAMTSCSATSRSMPRSTSRSPNDLCRPWIERAGVVIGPAWSSGGRGHRAPAAPRFRSRWTSQSVNRASGIVTTMNTSAVAT